MSDLYAGPPPIIDQPLEEGEGPFLGVNPVLSRTNRRRPAGSFPGPVAWTVGALVALAAIGAGAAYWVNQARQPSLFASTTAQPAMQQSAAPAAPAPAPAAATPAPAPTVQADATQAEATAPPHRSTTLARNERRGVVLHRAAKARAAEQTGADVSATTPSPQPVPSLPPATSAPPVLTPPPAS